MQNQLKFNFLKCKNIVQNVQRLKSLADCLFCGPFSGDNSFTCFVRCIFNCTVFFYFKSFVGSNDEGLTLETSAPLLPYGGITYFIYSFDYPNLLYSHNTLDEEHFG